MTLETMIFVIMICQLLSGLSVVVSFAVLAKSLSTLTKAGKLADDARHDLDQGEEWRNA